MQTGVTQEKLWGVIRLHSRWRCMALPLGASWLSQHTEGFLDKTGGHKIARKWAKLLTRLCIHWCRSRGSVLLWRRLLLLQLLRGRVLRCRLPVRRRPGLLWRRLIHWSRRMLHTIRHNFTFLHTFVGITASRRNRYIQGFTRVI